jgi:hypothetical protein
MGAAYAAFGKAPEGYLLQVGRGSRPPQRTFAKSQSSSEFNLRRADVFQCFRLVTSASLYARRNCSMAVGTRWLATCFDRSCCEHRWFEISFIRIDTASRLRKNCFSRQRFTSAAKAASEYAALTARLEAAPFQNRGEIRFFPQPARAID